MKAEGGRIGGRIDGGSGIGAEQIGEHLTIYAAQGHIAAVTSGGNATSFYVSPGGGAPSTGSTINSANLLLPSPIILQRGVTRASINCNDLQGHAEDLSVIRDYNQYAAIGAGTQIVLNSTGTGNAEIFGLSFAVTRDPTSGSPTVIGTVRPSCFWFDICFDMHRPQRDADRLLSKRCPNRLRVMSGRSLFKSLNGIGAFKAHPVSGASTTTVVTATIYTGFFRQARIRT